MDIPWIDAFLRRGQRQVNRHTYFNTSAEGADIIRSHIIRITDRAFDDFASTKNGVALNRLAFV